MTIEAEAYEDTITGTTVDVLVEITEYEPEYPTYKWSVLNKPVGSNPVFADDEDVETTVTFDRAGVYVIQVEVIGFDYTYGTTREVAAFSVAVTATLTSLVVVPATNDRTQSQFTVTGRDQFNNQMAIDLGEVTWSVEAIAPAIDDSGMLSKGGLLITAELDSIEGEFVLI